MTAALVGSPPGAGRAQHGFSFLTCSCFQMRGSVKSFVLNTAPPAVCIRLSPGPAGCTNSVFRAMRHGSFTKLRMYCTGHYKNPPPHATPQAPQQGCLPSVTGCEQLHEHEPIDALAARLEEDESPDWEQMESCAPHVNAVSSMTPSLSCVCRWHIESDLPPLSISKDRVYASWHAHPTRS